MGKKKEVFLYIFSGYNRFLNMLNDTDVCFCKAHLLKIGTPKTKTEKEFRTAFLNVLKERNITKKTECGE